MCTASKQILSTMADCQGATPAQGTSTARKRHRLSIQDRRKALRKRKNRSRSQARSRRALHFQTLESDSEDSVVQEEAGEETVPLPDSDPEEAPAVKFAEAVHTLQLRHNSEDEWATPKSHRYSKPSFNCELTVFCVTRIFIKSLCFFPVATPEDTHSTPPTHAPHCCFY